MMRSLDEGHLGILKTSHRLAQKLPDRHVIYVKHGNDFTGRTRQRMVEVTGLRMRVVLTAQIVTSDRLGERLDLVSPAVIENVDIQLLGWILLLETTHDGSF